MDDGVGGGGFLEDGNYKGAGLGVVCLVWHIQGSRSSRGGP